jgi:UDP-3-O-[3-hydroxymyristoyl] glucosamine N-acyltransferase
MTKQEIAYEEPSVVNPPKEIIREDVNMQYSLYITIFLLIYYGSWLLPVFTFFIYILNFFLPYFLEVSNFFSLFTELKSLITLVTFPLVLIGCYLIRLLFIGIMTRILWRLTEKISPSKSGIIPRNIRSKTANYYHLRSFMIKYGKNIFTKGPFPWLSNWFFRFVGSAKIGKRTTIEESVGNDKFYDIGNNCYLGVNSTLASHLVQGIFGNISYFEIKVGDNVTTAGMNQLGPGCELHDNSYLLPLASTSKHSILKGGHNYYFGIPLRKIFKKKIMEYLGITKKDIERNENLEQAIQELKERERKKKKKEEDKIELEKDVEESEEEEEEEEEEIEVSEELKEEELNIDFTTSSAISRINLKFLAVYLPIFWLAGLTICIYWYEYTKEGVELSTILFLPISILFMIYIFIFACLLFSKLILILINLIHKPKEGIFLAEIGDKDFEFWKARTEIKKITLWLLRNSPLTWLDMLAFKALGLKMDSGSHLNDAWCDAEFVDIGRKVLVGQGATVMSSMVIGKYLIIKKVIFDDYSMVGGHTTIAPGTIIGHDSVIGAVSSTSYCQVLKDNWIYFGFPAIPLKENKYAEERRDLIIKRDVDDEEKFEMDHEVNVDEDKKNLIKLKEDKK